MIQNFHSVTPSHLASRGGFPFPASPSAASRCSRALATLSVCLCWCLTGSGGATAGQHCCHVHRRQPAWLRPLPSRITPRFLSFPGHCHEEQPPPVRRPVSVAAGGNPPNKRLLPISAAHPTIDVMQSSRARRVYSPLRFAYGYITQAIVRRAAGGGSPRQGYAARSPFPAQVRCVPR